jgi:2-methylcitrate dehydratase PrpD
VVRDLARRIELEPMEEASHDGPHVWPAEITLEWAGARHVLRTRPHKGSPRNPFSWNEACEKFRRYTASMLAAPRAMAIIDAVGDLERLADVGDIARLVARS